MMDRVSRKNVYSMAKNDDDIFAYGNHPYEEK
jgi:hypothetical protein